MIKDDDSLLRKLKEIISEPAPTFKVRTDLMEEIATLRGQVIALQKQVIELAELLKDTRVVVYRLGQRTIGSMRAR